MWTHAQTRLALRSTLQEEQVVACVEIIERQWPPTHWGWMSNDRRPYSREAMLSWIFDGETDLTGFEPTVRSWSRPAYKFMMNAFVGECPFVELDLLPPATSEELGDLFALSEELAGVLGVELGGVSLDGILSGRPWSCGPQGVDIQDVRARGLGKLFPRMYLCPALWARIEALLEPARVRALRNGVISVDLVDEPWLASPENLNQAIADAQARLELAGVAAGEGLKAGLNWVPIT